MKITHKEYEVRRRGIIQLHELKEGEEGYTLMWLYKEHPSKGCKAWREGDRYCTAHDSYGHITRHSYELIKECDIPVQLL